jgi:hypothetical protein
MKVAILSNEQYTNQQKNTVGSTRIRSTWVLKHWPEAEEFKIGVKYDAIIFQKAYFLDYLRIYDGIKILDICDPDWMEGRPVVEAAALCDAVAVSSEGLLKYLDGILSTPVYYVPDTFDPMSHREKKEHAGRAKECVWFGYHHNQVVLDSVLPTLKRLGLTLTVISDLPYFPTSAIHGVDKGWLAANIKNVKFDPDTLNEEIIMGGDMVLNNRTDEGKFRYKSDNKTIIAWALGMPVAKTAEDVDRFMDHDARVFEANKRVTEVYENWTSERTVHEYKQIITDIAAKKGLPEPYSKG